MVDDHDDLSGFLLGLATSCTNLGVCWVLTFTTDGIAPAGNSLFASISPLFDKMENTVVHPNTAWVCMDRCLAPQSHRP